MIDGFVTKFRSTPSLARSFTMPPVSLSCGALMESFSWPICSGKKWRKTSKVFAISRKTWPSKTSRSIEIPYVPEYNKRDLNNVAPIDPIEFVLNNREKTIQASRSSRALDKTSLPRSMPSRRCCSTSSANKAQPRPARLHRRGVGRTGLRAETRRSRHRMNYDSGSDDPRRRHARRHPCRFSC